MAPRAYWKGYLKLSLVSCPIALFPASSEREKISFHQLNKKTGHRIKYRKVDAETGDEVESADIIKGYEVGKGDYIELDPEELEAVAIESKRTIDIDEFVPKDEIDELYLNNPYYIAPDGEVGQQAFTVIREAIRKEGMVAIGSGDCLHMTATLCWSVCPQNGNRKKISFKIVDNTASNVCVDQNSDLENLLQDKSAVGEGPSRPISTPH